MPQEEYNRLSTITEDTEKNGIAIKNRSQPCGLTNSKNWNLVSQPSKNFKRIETFTMRRRRRYIGKKISQEMDLELTSVPLRMSSIWSC